MPMLEDVGTYIVANSLAQGEGVDLYANNAPASPDNLTVLTESTGFAPERTMGRIALEVVNLQVLVRDINSSNGESRIRAIFFLLDRFTGLLVPSGVRIAQMLARSSPFTLGQDEEGRYKYVVNFIVWRDPS